MLWNSAGSLIYLISQWVITVLVTRLFGYSDAGVLSLAMSLTSTFQTIALFGIRSFQASDINGKYGDNIYVMLRNITCTASLVICMAFSLINGYSDVQVFSILWFMLFRLSENYSDVIHGIAQKNGRLDIAGKGLAIKGILCLAVFIICSLLGQTLNACLALMALSAWLVTIAFDLTVVRKICTFRLTASFSASLGLCRETIPLCVYMFLSSGITVVPKYFLEKMTDPATLGAYASISAPALIVSAVTMYIYTPFIGTFADLYRKRKTQEFINTAAKIIMAILAFGALVVAAAALFGDIALTLVFGESILEFSYMLIPAFLATVAAALLSFLYVLSIVIRDFRNLILGCSVGFIAASVLSPVMINLFGADGASYAMLLGSIPSAVYMAASILTSVRRNPLE